ncbi:uncharacterized protein B0P05DRAFT_601010 [Gilbertella persicaria]|uniref:uncharacterized protein n=1 Tax=Gilbertella persicaria TaxID=101096 RepID=UPI00221EE524|nr:uncharacterized protein B0P05DRAFT_601010 [Gilbertella persicaria]KAI8047730.1 hypothetical protein B0P05DRAFT_601010 [Gilbertella persicaria]
MSIELDLPSCSLLAALCVAIAVIVLKYSNQPDTHPRMLCYQSEFYPASCSGESAIIRSKLYPKGPPSLSTIETLSGFYHTCLSRNKEGKQLFLGARANRQSTILWHSYDNALERVKHIYSGLICKTNLRPCTDKSSSFLGIYASCSPEVYMTEIACHWGGLVTVPIAAQAISSHILHVIRNAGLSVLMIDDTHLEFILDLILGSSITHIIVITHEQQSYREMEPLYGIKIFSLFDLEKIGQEYVIERHKKISPDSIASIYYSNPKHNTFSDHTNRQEEKSLGVVLTHKNIMSVIGKLLYSYSISLDRVQLASYLVHFPSSHKATPKDRLMHSYSIDNILGYVFEAVICYAGGSVVFEDKVLLNEFNLDTSLILPAIYESKPTIYASGGPFLRQIQKTIESKYGNSFLYHRGLDRKCRYHNQGKVVSDCIYDMLVFRDIRQRMFGGSIRVLLVEDDDAPKTDICTFYRAVLGAQVIKTFSRPEMSSSMVATIVYDYTHDKRAIGAPLACSEIKLIDTKEYTVKDVPHPRGEIQVRGSHIFKGYWNHSALKDQNGWYSTGMLGELLPNGTLIMLGSAIQQNMDNNK